MEQSLWLNIFPSSILPQNIAAFDWGGCNICAFSTKSTIHFSFIDIHNKMNRLYSIDFRSVIIECIKFHPVFRRLAISDDNGRIIFWDVDLRAAFGSAILFPTQLETKVICMKWVNNHLIALYNNQHLACFTHSPSNQADHLVNISLVWDLPLSHQFTHFSIDSSTKSNGDILILLNDNNNFCLYTTNSITNQPTCNFDKISLNSSNQNLSIKDVQWSYHFPNFCFVLCDNDIFLFHVPSKSFVQLIKNKRSAQDFSQFIQRKNHFNELILLHKNGMISMYDIYNIDNECFETKLIYEIQQKYASSSIISFKQSYYKDDFIILLLDSFGLGLFSIDKKIITSILPIIPSNITCVDCQNGKYCYGTNDGYIITGNFTDSIPRRFCVAKEMKGKIPVENVILSKDKIFWSSDKELGEIDLKYRKSNIYFSRVKTILKTKGSFKGAFGVQRAKTEVSVFINKKEIPSMFEHDVIDFCFSDESNGKEGILYVIFSNNELVFYPYSEKTGITNPSGKYSIINDGDATSLASKSNNLCISFSNGSVILFKIGNPNSIKAQTGLKDIKSVSFVDNGAVLGIGENNQLFCIGSKVRVCQLPTIAFAQASSESILLLGSDHILRLVRLKDWQLYSKFSTSFSAFPIEQIQTMKILSHNEEDHIFRPESNEIWNILHSFSDINNKIPFSTIWKNCCGNCKFYLKVINQLYSLLPNNDEENIDSKFVQTLFANDFELASKILLSKGPGSKNFMRNAALSGCLIASNSEEKEALAAHLKSVSLSLFLSGKFMDGSIFMRIIRQDRAAADYLIEYGEYDIAKKFIMLLDDDEKKDLLVKLAIEIYKKGKKRNAMYLFASAKEFQPALQISQEMGMLLDSYYIKQFVQEKGWLHPLELSSKKFPFQLMDIETLSQKIDSDFHAFCAKLKSKHETNK